MQICIGVEGALAPHAQQRRIPESTHNLCEVGGLVYKYFGESLTGEQFKEILDVLFKMNGVQELVNAEKEKRTSMNDVGTEDEKEKAEPSGYYSSEKFSA